MLKIAWSPTYVYDLPKGHRFPMLKYELIPQQLLLEGTIVEEQIFYPTPLSNEDILLTHTCEYLDKLHHLTLSAKEIRNIGFPFSQKLVERGKHIAHGTFMCAKFALEYGISMNTAGGTHHAFSDRGEGFCIFNDIAIAANLLLKHELATQILIIDLDVHQGNGTAKIFEEQQKVYTFSMHGEKNYPLRKESSNLDIGLLDNTDDETYLHILKSTLPPIIEKVKPDFIFYLSGVDVLETDLLGRIKLSRAGCKKRDHFILEVAKKNKTPIAVSMGGGYSPKMIDILEAHCNTFRLAQEMFF